MIGAGAALGLPPLPVVGMAVEIWVAVISAIGVVGAAVVGGPVMYIVHRLRRENTEQHAQSLTVITDIAEKVGRVDEKVDRVSDLINDHTEWHRKNDDV